MAQSFDPATREALLTRVRFYRDLGLTEFYRRPVDPALLTVGGPGLAFETWESTNLNPGPKTTQSAGCSILSSAAADERVGNHNPHTFEKLSTRLIHGSRPLPQFPLNLRSLCPVSGGFYHRLSLSSKGTPP